MAGTCFGGQVSWRVHCSTQARQMVAYSPLDQSVILHIGQLGAERCLCHLRQSQLSLPGTALSGMRRSPDMTWSGEKDSVLIRLRGGCW